MDENFNSEHGFNCKYAEHKVGTNRYIFKYPETFYSSMNDRRLYFGLRSIIVKLEPLFLDFSKFTYVSLVAKYGYHLGDYYYELNNIYQESGVKVEGTTNNEYLLTVRPSAGGQILYPERMPLDIRFTISPEMKMTDVCSLINRSYNNVLENYRQTYETQKERRRQYLVYTHDIVFDNITMTPNMLEATYDKDRTFTLITRSSSSDFLMFPYKSEKTKVFYSKFNTIIPESEFEIEPNMADSLNIFSEDFEALLGLNLRFSDGWSLNKLLAAAGGLNKYWTPARVHELYDRFGVEFINVNRIVYDKNCLWKQYQRSPYELLSKTEDPDKEHEYVYCILFQGLRVKNVWSRNDILIRSSIAEMDEQNYLGYSTMNDSSGVCIYSTPKMYPIESHDYKFWVDLYDTLKETPIELPDKVVLIIEGILHQNAKPDFINYQKYE